VDFAADWCTPCEELELTFADPDVYDAISTSFVPLKFDVTDSTDTNMERRSRYGADTLPSVVFMSADGTVLGRVREYIEADAMMNIVTPAANKLATK
jgi:thiol:disulfide interchange protein